MHRREMGKRRRREVEGIMKPSEPHAVNGRSIGWETSRAPLSRQLLLEQLRHQLVGLVSVLLPSGTDVWIR